MPFRADEDNAITTFTNALKSGLPPSKCGFFFDFDGTLALIELDPATVQPLDGLVSRLDELAVTFGRVAVVSGRSVAFLSSRFRSVRNIHYFGLYGLERGIDDSEVSADPLAESYAETMSIVADLATAQLPEGAGVEHKRLVVALHYRADPSIAEAVLSWAQGMAEQYGLALHKGRMVYELKPPLTLDKGTVVVEHSADLNLVWYFGDDIGDIPAFESLTRLDSARDDFTAILVAIHNAEGGSVLEELATVVLPGPTEVPRLLDRILTAAKSLEPD